MATSGSHLVVGEANGTQIAALGTLTASTDVNIGTNVKFAIVGSGDFHLAFNENTTGPTLAAASKVWQFDDSGGTYVDITTAFNDATAGDTNPWPAVEGVADRMYIGYVQPIDSLRFIISTAGVGGTLTWKYYNGAWTALSAAVDGTSNLTATAGTHNVTYTRPTDWVRLVINGSESLYWIAAEVAGVYATNPVLSRGFVGVGQPGVYSSSFRVPANTMLTWDTGSQWKSFNVYNPSTTTTVDVHYIRLSHF